MSEADIIKLLMDFENVSVDRKIDPKYLIFKTKVESQEKIFALILVGSNPVQLTLKCDRLLAKKLREDFETVMPATNMSKNYWNKIVCSGQLPDEQIKDLINLSYHLVTDSR